MRIILSEEKLFHKVSNTFMDVSSVNYPQNFIFHLCTKLDPEFL